MPRCRGWCRPPPRRSVGEVRRWRRRVRLPRRRLRPGDETARRRWRRRPAQPTWRSGTLRRPHPLLTGWLEKLEAYRMWPGRFSALLGRVAAIPRGDARFPPRLRRDGLPCLHPPRAAARPIGPQKKTSADSAIPWRTTWRDGRPPWSAAGPRATGLPIAVQVAAGRGGKTWRWQWHYGWKLSSAAGIPPSSSITSR